MITRYGERILPFGLETSKIWGILLAGLERRGRTLPIADSMIAATAIEHGLTIVTRNTEDFAPANVSVLNIWK